MITSDTRRRERLGAPASAPAPAEAVTHLCHDDGTPPRVAGLLGAFNLWKRVMLRFQIASSERYLELCRTEGIVDGKSIREWHFQLQQQRRQLAALEAQR